MFENLIHEFETSLLVLAALGTVVAAYGGYMAVRHGVPWVADKLKGIKVAATTDYATIVADYRKLQDLVKLDLSGLDGRVTAIEALLKSVIPKAGA